LTVCPFVLGLEPLLSNFTILVPPVCLIFDVNILQWTDLVEGFVNTVIPLSGHFFD
jgi:hypothetical protein